MRIDLFNTSATQIASEGNAQPAKTANTLASGVEVAGDRTTLSSGSTAVGSLVSEAMKSPEIRQDKVQVLQHQIASGQYSLDPDQIAGAMLDEHA